MNLAGAVIFALPIFGIGEVFGLPNAHPLYLGIISSWILIFGVSYLWLAVTAKPDRFYIAVVAEEQISDRHSLHSILGNGDFFLAIAFISWLLQIR
ncbi:hypothetical protein [Cylindrospermum sp. FACHB-282]|uniref:hypothetical protein n=1 Tax=Cylindrospermum sp. FACHB-282 TaxID=2692794 RepID=UPI00168314B6|nr:hypothetical protein [Cylindrospermum sp. FACHB-282]MBD2385260.1 hypothetical protein [Cylindrospermum sp. FACHB-282]